MSVCFKYYECVFSSRIYPACKAHAPHYIAICGLSTIFLHIFSKAAPYSEKSYLIPNVCFDFL